MFWYWYRESIDFIVAPNLSGTLPVREQLVPDIEILVEQHLTTQRLIKTVV